MEKRKRMCIASIGIVFAIAIFLMMFVSGVEKAGADDIQYQNTPSQIVDGNLTLKEIDDFNGLTGFFIVNFIHNKNDLNVIMMLFAPLVDRFAFMPRVYVEQDGRSVEFDAIGYNATLLQVVQPKWFKFGDTVKAKTQIFFGGVLPDWIDFNKEILVVILDLDYTIIHTFVNPSIQR